jgi:hypothetical protein
MPWTPSDDPVWLQERHWTSEQIVASEGYQKAIDEGGIAAALVFTFTRYGLSRTAGFLREAKYNKAQLFKASVDLKRVGGFDLLARLVATAAEMKPKGPPSWKQRVAAKNRRRRK